MKRLVVAWEAYTGMGQGLLVAQQLWQYCGSGKPYKDTPLESPICLKGGQSSLGDPVNTLLRDITWTLSYWGYCWLQLAWKSRNSLTKEGQGMEIKLKQASALLTQSCCFKGIYSKTQVSEKVENIHWKKACFSSMTLNVTAGYPWQQPKNSWVSIKGECKGEQGPVLPVSLIIHFHVCISNWFLGCWAFLMFNPYGW